MTTITDVIVSYWDWIENLKRLRPATCTAYIGDLRALSRYLDDKPIEAITSDDIEAYMKHLSAQGKAVSTVRRQVHGFGTFWEWAYRRRYAAVIVTEGLIKPKRRRKQPVWMTEDELKRFASTPAPTPRESLAWGLFAWLGLRFGEVFNLTAGDVLLDAREIIVRESKGDDRVIPIPAALYEPLRAAVDGLPADRRLFARWGKNSFYAAFRDHLARCGLAGRGFTFRSLRHSFVTHRLDRGVPIHVVKDLAGHKRIDTTAVYAHASASGKRAAIEDSPLGEIQR